MKEKRELDNFVPPIMSAKHQMYFYVIHLLTNLGGNLGKEKKN